MVAMKFVKKGSPLFVEGKLSYRQYDDKEGNRHYISELVADHVILLDKKPA